MSIDALYDSHSNVFQWEPYYEQHWVQQARKRFVIRWYGNHNKIL